MIAKGRFDSIDYLKQAIDEYALSLLPEKRIEDPEVLNRDYLSMGWNACIEQIKKNIDNQS